MVEGYDYRYELIDFRRHDDGSSSYQTRSQGEIQIPFDPRKPFESSSLKLNVWKTARELAERTKKDIIIYVFGRRIVSRTRSVCNSSFI